MTGNAVKKKRKEKCTSEIRKIFGLSRQTCVCGNLEFFNIVKWYIIQNDTKYAGWYQVPKRREKQTELAKVTNEG